MYPEIKNSETAFSEFNKVFYLFAISCTMSINCYGYRRITHNILSDIQTEQHYPIYFAILNIILRRLKSAFITFLLPRLSHARFDTCIATLTDHLAARIALRTGSWLWRCKPVNSTYGGINMLNYEEFYFRGYYAV
jgi:hypothetical protein